MSSTTTASRTRSPLLGRTATGVATLLALLLTASCLEPPAPVEEIPIQEALPSPQPLAQDLPSARSPERPRPRGWFLLSGDIEMRVENAEVHAELRPAGPGNRDELTVELLLRYGAGLAPVAGVVLVGLTSDLPPGNHIVHSPEAGSGVRAFVTVQSDRVGTMRDLNREVRGVLQVDPDYSEAISATFRISAVEAPPVSQPPAPVPDGAAVPPLSGTAPEPPPARIEARGGFYLPLSAARPPDPELLELPATTTDRTPEADPAPLETPS